MRVFLVIVLVFLVMLTGCKNKSSNGTVTTNRNSNSTTNTVELSPYGVFEFLDEDESLLLYKVIQEDGKDFVVMPVMSTQPKTDPEKIEIILNGREFSYNGVKAMFSEDYQRLQLTANVPFLGERTLIGSRAE